jgi:hypothetical protein
MSEARPRDGLEEAFWIFHRDNPWVWRELVRLARSLKHRGWQHYGIGALWEVMRFHRAMETTDPEFKYNNNHRALYAREIMDQCPDLADFFEIRERTTTRPCTGEYDPFINDPEPRLF